MTYTPLKEWIPLNRQASPTAATTALHKTIASLGADIKNLGQGREIVELPLLKSTLNREFATAAQLTSSEYNGPANLRATTAAWMMQILSIETTKDTSFVLQALGREALNQAFGLMKEMANFPADGIFLVPDTYWPMIKDQLRRSNFKPAVYAMQRGHYAVNIERQLIEARNKGEIIVGVYINSPHNPTGLILNTNEFREIFEVLDRWNSNEECARRHGQKIGIIMDLPYAHACTQLQRADGMGLDTGLEVFKQDTLTPWIIPVSTSKCLGTASPGFTMIASHPHYANGLTEALVTTTGFSYMPPFFKALDKVLAPENYATVLAHFANLAAKYHANRTTIETAFPENVVDGDPGMTAVIEMDPQTFQGRKMATHNGSEFLINDLNDFIEYAANDYGIAAVNNGLDSKGFALLRIAAAQTPENYAEGISRLKMCVTNVAATPVRVGQPKIATAPSDLKS